MLMQTLARCFSLKHKPLKNEVVKIFINWPFRY